MYVPAARPDTIKVALPLTRSNSSVLPFTVTFTLPVALSFPVTVMVALAP